MYKECGQSRKKQYVQSKGLFFFGMQITTNTITVELRRMKGTCISLITNTLPIFNIFQGTLYNLNSQRFKIKNLQEK